MKKTLILLFLGSFSVQLTAMSDNEKLKLAEIEVKEQEEQNSLNQQFIKAILDKNYEEMKIALENGADPNTFDESDDRYYPSLILLIQNYANINITKALVHHPKINLDATTDTGNTALHEASYSFNSEIIKLLVNAGASLDLNENQSGGTPLLMLFLGICEHGVDSFIGDNTDDYLDIAKLLVSEKNINMQDDYGNTPLIEAIRLELYEPAYFHDSDLHNSDLIEHFINNCGASVTIKNNDGKTALDIAKEIDNHYLKAHPHIKIKIINLLENKLKQVKELQAKIKKEVLDATPLPEALANLTSEYLESVGLVEIV